MVNLITLRAAEWFVSLSMCLLAIQKLQDVRSFSTMFLNYDLLAKRWVPYGFVYPFAEATGRHPDDSARAAHHIGPSSAVHRQHWRVQRVQGGIHRQARTEMRLRRRKQQCAARLRIADREPVHDRHGSVDGCQSARMDRCYDPTIEENNFMEHDKQQAGQNGSGGNYGRFMAMVGTSTAIMFVLMYLNTYALEHVFWSETRFWMTFVMGAVMAVVMLLFMWGMYRNTAKNWIILGVAAVVFSGALFLVRSQTTVNDSEWMSAMIPHHSIAILTSERANID